MIEFEALKATSLKKAKEILADKKHDVKIVAGGTDMLVQIHHEGEDVKDMKYLMDITSIPEINRIEDKGEYYLVTSQLHMIAGRNEDQ